MVATPIGNLGDLTSRARDVLGRVTVVVAEDTRRTGKLLRALGISTRLESFHAHSGPRRAEAVVAMLDEGDVAYVTDAGTPGVSDPGAELVAAAMHAGHRVAPAPGPSAFTAALSVSGVEAAGAVLLGFLPRRPAKRSDLLDRAGRTGLPVVIFCSPRTVNRTLAECAAVFGEGAPVVVCRELTKLYEEVVAATIGQARDLEAVRKARGEYVLVVGPVALAPAAVPEDQMVAEMTRQRAAGFSLKEASAKTAEKLGVSRKLAYRAGLRKGE